MLRVCLSLGLRSCRSTHFFLKGLGFVWLPSHWNMCVIVIVFPERVFLLPEGHFTLRSMGWGRRHFWRGSSCGTVRGSLAQKHMVVVGVQKLAELKWADKAHARRMRMASMHWKNLQAPDEGPEIFEGETILPELDMSLGFNQICSWFYVLCTWYFVIDVIHYSRH